jgi:CO dehydrogenase/acetyl-CoA synthase beta subunit
VKAYEIHLRSVREYIAERVKQGRLIREMDCPTDPDKALAGLPIRVGVQEKANIILREDTFVELGNPSIASSAFVVWTDDLSWVKDGHITLIGPDIQESEGGNLPFGQVIIAGGAEFKEEHYLELERTQYPSDRIEGYMLRSVPRRVWSRVSKEAAGRGFCFETLGRALIAIFKSSHPVVQAIEVVFVTSSKEDVEQLDNIAVDVRKFSGELRKLVRQSDGTYECSEYSCATCDEKAVCDSIRDMVTLRRKMAAGTIGEAN